MLLGAAAIAQQQVQIPYSTHDWTVSATGPEPIDVFPEAWADVKSPGDKRQYTVGTIEVKTTTFPAFFSQASAEPATGLTPFSFSVPGARRQVVMLQCTDATTQNIIWQRYFYGITTNDETRASNARAVSVWPTGDPATTRVAICGETYDTALPASTGAFAAATTTAPTGFIAVFNGAGDLLWTHHVYGVDAEQSCAITDLSIRVEAVSALEVVTYCGISSHGNPGAGLPLSPKKDFAALGMPASSGGSTNQGSGQWDGIVGRVSQSAATGVAPEFHSIVGGPDQDGLWGLAEIVFDPEHELDRFVVVGATRLTSSAAPPTGFAHPGFVGIAGRYYIGTVLFFDAAPTHLPMGDLVLESVLPLGQFSTETEDYFTLARDVVTLKDGLPGTAQSVDLVAVAGSTNSPLLPFFAVWPSAPAHSVLQGDTDGFLATILDVVGAPSTYQIALHGGPDRDGLTGAQGWSEFSDQVSVVGFRQSQSNQDILVASYHLGLDTPVSIATYGQLHSVRADVLGGSSVDRPTAMGAVHATNTGLAFATGPGSDSMLLGEPAGGGIAVDQRARVNAVGQTLSTDYLSAYSVTTPSRPVDVPADAIRTVVDMLPFGTGIGRTDQSGDQTGFTPVSGFSGGTTPECALSPFGWRIGDSRPELKRMLVDYVGSAPAVGVTDASIVVSRPTAPILPGGVPSSLMAAFFQAAMPNATGSPPILWLPDGIEFWVTHPTLNILSPLYVGPNEEYRQDLIFPSGTSGPLTIQLVCLIAVPVTGGAPGACSPSSASLTASPAIWLPY